MVKAILSALIAALVIVALGITENAVLNKHFGELTEELNVIQLKIKDGSCKKKDILEFQSDWIERKKTLHVFIPHTEIKEIDLWISECVYYAGSNDYKEALAKTEVTKELFEQIPKTFLVRIENLF